MWMFVSVCVSVCAFMHSSSSMVELKQKKCSLRCTQKQKTHSWGSALVHLNLRDIIKSLFYPPRWVPPPFSLPLPPSFSVPFTPSPPSSLFILIEEETWSFPQLCSWHTALGCDGDQANCATVISIFHRHQQKKTIIKCTLIRALSCSSLFRLPRFFMRGNEYYTVKADNSFQ